ncbi:C-type lectin domain family 9 member A-like isoform X1 [Mobula birostris]|uniref:C-type lectin domain family 9 member A-like isoform X1 n=1 Tax=Mobula birostris TaxID=1983395 RepID=UPI003B28D4E3
MVENETYADRQLAGWKSPAPSGAEPDCSYVELNFTAVSAPRVRRDGDGLTSTYSEVNFRNDDHLMNEDEAPPIGSRLRKLPDNALSGPHKREPKDNLGNRSNFKICLLCLVTSALIVTVAGLSIYVSQIRQSQIISEKNYQLLCQFLTNNRETTCPKDWIRNKERCYYVSIFETSFYTAMQECSNRDSRLFEINARDEAKAVFLFLRNRNLAYWIGKCEDGNVASGLLLKIYPGTPACGHCDRNGGSSPCDRKHGFICEKSAHLFPDFPQEIQDLCQQPVGPI